MRRLIDLDPQGYLTSGVGLEAEYTAESTTLYDALQYPPYQIKGIVCCYLPQSTSKYPAWAQDSVH